MIKKQSNIICLLNPADVDNPNNDKEAMDDLTNEIRQNLKAKLG